MEVIEVSEISKEERNWGMFAHLSSLLGYLGIPFVNIIAPLVIWQIRKEDMPFAAKEAKECLNFQISVSIYILVSCLLFFLIVGIFTFIAVLILNIVYTIIAALKANEGQSYRYPFTIRFVN